MEVRQCPLGSGARGGGPAVPTGIWEEMEEEDAEEMEEEDAEAEEENSSDKI